MVSKCTGTGSCEFATLKASCAAECEPFKLDDSESQMFDHFAQESVGAYGTDILFWKQDIVQSIRDPLYDEVIDRAWKGPYKLVGYVEYMAGDTSMREEGMTVRWEGKIWISRKEFEDHGVGVPLEGDVVKFWDNRFFSEQGVNSETDVHGGYYFDITNADDAGHMFDTAHFVGFSMTVLRRTEFTPERRLES